MTLMTVVSACRRGAHSLVPGHRRTLVHYGGVRIPDHSSPPPPTGSEGTQRDSKESAAPSLLLVFVPSAPRTSRRGNIKVGVRSNGPGGKGVPAAAAGGPREDSEARGTHAAHA